MRGVASALAASNYELVIYTVDSPNRIQGYLSSIPFTGNLDGLIELLKQHEAFAGGELEVIQTDFPKKNLQLEPLDFGVFG